VPNRCFTLYRRMLNMRISNQQPFSVSFAFREC
jgi:hypothetical protein